MSFYGFLSSLSSPTLICGDFTIRLHTDTMSSLNFKSMLDSCNLVQHIDFPTHIHGDTLDCLITPSDFTGIGCIGDHFCVGCRLDFRSPSKYTVKQITFRQYHRINRDQMRCDLLNTAFFSSPSDNAFALYAQGVSNVSYVPDQHAPLKTKCLTKPKPGKRTPPLSIDQSCDAKSVNVTLSSTKHMIIFILTSSTTTRTTRKCCGKN